jgi:hypothetical protein
MERCVLEGYFVQTGMSSLPTKLSFTDNKNSIHIFCSTTTVVFVAAVRSGDDNIMD